MKIKTRKKMRLIFTIHGARQVVARQSDISKMSLNSETSLFPGI